MSSGYQLLFAGKPAEPDLYTELSSLEVEENVDLPGAIQLKLPVNRSEDGDLTYVNDDRLKPLANLAVVVTPSATAAGGLADAVTGALGAVTGAAGNGAGTQCIFDGYVLSHKLHLEKGTTNSTLSVWGQDASWLMNLEEKAKEWVDMTDGDVANAVFGVYGITPDSRNTQDDSPSHTEDGHSLMQRGSDIQFLRGLARRNGKLCRVACKDKPGQRTGYFAKPDLSADPACALDLSDLETWTLDSLDLEWDATRPSAVVAHQAVFTDDDPDGVSADTSDSGLAALGDRGLADFVGQPMTVLLTAPVDDGGELTLRAESLLREGGWFVRCEAEADVARLGSVIRAGTVVAVGGAGAAHSGKYFVWSVRHTITSDSHKMKVVLVRNAVGNPPGGGGGGALAALAGAL